VIAAPTDPDTGIDATLAFGKQLYDETAGGIGCAACHGLDGKGTAAGPNINGVSKSAIADALGRGIPGMDSIKLDPDELEAVYRYVRTLP
jgi:mono/diheme cytochrome c family protein